VIIGIGLLDNEDLKILRLSPACVIAITTSEVVLKYASNLIKGLVPGSLLVQEDSAVCFHMRGTNKEQDKQVPCTTLTQYKLKSISRSYE
jgi:hypothetical protein